MPDFKTYTFTNGLPADFSAGPGSTLKVDRSRFQSGGASLRWEWTGKNASITYNNPAAFKQLTGQNPDPIVYDWVTCTTLSAISMWIYNEKPCDKKLRFEIGHGDKVDCRFYIILNFKGWLNFKALYGRDIEGFPDQKLADTLRIIAPAGIPQGVLNIDSFCPRTEQDVRFVKSSPAAPWVFRRPTQTVSQFSGLKNSAFDQSKTDFAANENIPLPTKITPQTLADMRRMQKEKLAKYREQPFSSRQALGRVDSVRRAYKKHNIVHSGKSISGSIGNAKVFWAEALTAARVYKALPADSTAKPEMLRIFLDYAALYAQHGKSSGYSMRDTFAAPMLLMKSELKSAAIYEPLYRHLRGLCGVAEFYDHHTEANADIYNTQLAARLFLIFVQDWEADVYRDLKALQGWLTQTAQYGEIRPDGSFFHHNQTYSGYNLPAIGPLVEVNAMLHGTEFASPLSLKYARRIAYALHFYSNFVDIPHTLSGRWRSSGRLDRNNCRIFRLLAECGDQNGNVPDRKMAAIYLYYADFYKVNDSYTEQYRRLGIKPAAPSGHLSLNYTVAAIHRRADWMVFFRGQRAAINCGETYAVSAANTMGRYLNFGHMCIISSGNPPNAVDSGWPLNGRDIDFGWNFNFWPGTTARRIPLNALRAHFQVEEWVTSEPFAAGTSLDGNGIFGMKLREDIPGMLDPKRIGPVRYWLGDKEYFRRIKDMMIDTSFRAHKSVFCFNDRILCLGSGISSTDTVHNVCTTLFQYPLQNIVEVEQPRNTDKTGDASWLVDCKDLGYYLAAGNGDLTADCKMRHLPYHNYWAPKNPANHNNIIANEGITQLAILNHGKAPQNAGYEYCIVMKANRERMQRFTEAMRNQDTAYYHILRKDNAAHIVYDVPSATVGYVMFEAGRAGLQAEQPGAQLQAVSRPSLVMLKNSGNRLRISVCDPDIGKLSQDIAPQVKVKLTLAGHWRKTPRTPQAVSVRPAGENTEVTVTDRDAIPVVFELVKTTE